MQERRENFEKTSSEEELSPRHSLPILQKDSGKPITIEDFLAMLNNTENEESTDSQTNKVSIDPFSFTGRPWENNHPFKPYSSLGECVEGTGQTVLFSSGFLAFSALAASVSAILVGCAGISLALSPVSGIASGLMAAGRRERQEEESLFQHMLASAKNGVMSGLTTFAWTLVVPAVCLVLSAAAMLVSAILLTVSALTAVLGTAMQATRLMGTAGAGIKKAAVAGLSLFTGKSEKSTVEEETELLAMATSSPQ